METLQGVEREIYVMVTRLCNLDPLKLHFYIMNLAFKEVFPYF